MGKFERFNNIYRLFVATSVSVIATLLLDHIQKIIKDRTIQWLALLVIISIVLFIVDQLFESVLERSSTLRSLVAGSQYIEGYWYDISIDRQDNSIHHGSLINICWEEGALSVSGIEFDSNGVRLSTFRSTSTAFTNRVLTFGYESHGESFDHAIKVGIDQLQFDNPPLSYSGVYVDFTEAVSFRIQGTRVDQQTLDEHNRFRDLRSKQRFIVDQIGIAARQSSPTARRAQAS